MPIECLERLDNSSAPAFELLPAAGHSAPAAVFKQVEFHLLLFELRKTVRYHQRHDTRQAQGAIVKPAGHIPMRRDQFRNYQ